MNIREITIQDINVQKAFSPIREIILFDQKKWEKFINDDSQKNLSAIENLFAINEIYPEGMSGTFRDELGKFMATLDTFQCSLSFIYSLTEDKKFKNVLNDYRMTIQNFQVYLENKSFYSALMEFRKMLEGVLWMRFMVDNNDAPEDITRFEYKKQLEKINCKFGIAYSTFNGLYHYKKWTPFIDLNKLYNEKDHLFEYLNVIDGITDLYENEINRFMKSFNNKTLKRYKLILKKLDKSRKSYNLINKKINPSGQNHFRESQEMFAELINKFNIYKITEFEIKYINGLHNRTYKKSNLPKYNQFDAALLYMIEKYGNEFRKYENIFNPNSLIWNQFYKAEISIIWISKRFFSLLEEICLMLLERELKKGGSRNIAFLRSIMEDIHFNFAINKNTSYMHTSLISDFLNIEYKIKIININKRYSHILRDKRIIYNKEKNSSKESQRQKYMQKELIIYLGTFKKIIHKL